MSTTLLVEALASLPDPRVARTRIHKLVDILAIALLAVINDANGWEEMAAFGRKRHNWLAAFLELPGGLPCADTYRRVFEAIDTDAFGACLLGMTADLAADVRGRVVAIDGKTMRGSSDRRTGLPALHMVSAWVAEHGITLGQVATEEKSNEITAIPQLIKTLDLRGAIVTIDAMGCQKKIAEAIVQAEAGYALALKDNHPTLRTEVEGLFAAADMEPALAANLDVHTSESKGHGRCETRRVSVLKDVAGLTDAAGWAGLKCVVMVERTRTVGDSRSLETAYYLTSEVSDAKRMGEIIRSHWSIENNLHWVLDVVFREDLSRVRSRGGAANLTAIRKLALSLLMLEQSEPGTSIARKRKIASWEPDYAFLVLDGISRVLDALALGRAARRRLSVSTRRSGDLGLRGRGYASSREAFILVTEVVDLLSVVPG